MLCCIDVILTLFCRDVNGCTDFFFRYKLDSVSVDNDSCCIFECSVSVVGWSACIASDKMEMEYQMAGACSLWLEVPTLAALILVAEPPCVAVHIVMGMSFLPFESKIHLVLTMVLCDFAYFDSQSGGPLALILGSA